VIQGFYPGFSESNKIRVVSINTVSISPDNTEEWSGCKIDGMLSSGRLAIRLTIAAA